MAKIIITIEDSKDGKVKCVCKPTFEQMIKLHGAKKGLQASHGYALCAINAIRKASKVGAPFQAIVDEYNKGEKSAAKRLHP